MSCLERGCNDMNDADYPYMEKEEYIAELQKALSGIETYKVRYFYIFTMAKLGLIPSEI